MPLVPELGFVPDLDAISAEDAERARLMFLNYPNNPTGAVVPDGFFEKVVEFARANDILVVHDASVHRDHLRRLRGAQLPGDARAPRRSASRSSRCPRATT